MYCAHALPCLRPSASCMEGAIPPIGVSWAHLCHDKEQAAQASGPEREQLMGKKSQMILIAGSPGLNSKHVPLSPGCPDLTGRAKDSQNNVGWAGAISIHCRSRGNGVLPRRGVLTRLPARSGSCSLSEMGHSGPLSGRCWGRPGCEGSTRGPEGRDFVCQRTFVLNGKKIAELKRGDSKGKSET